jgi:hypothetical protein
LNIDPVDWAVVEVGHIDRAEILQDQVVALTNELTLLPRHMRARQAEVALRPTANESPLGQDFNPLANSGAGENLDK